MALGAAAAAAGLAATSSAAGIRPLAAAARLVAAGGGGDGAGGGGMSAAAAAAAMLEGPEWTALLDSMVSYLGCSGHVCRWALQQAGGAGPAPDAAMSWARLARPALRCKLRGGGGRSGRPSVAAAAALRRGGGRGGAILRIWGATVRVPGGESWRRFLQTMAQAAAVCPVLHVAGGKARRQLAELGAVLGLMRTLPSLAADELRPSQARLLGGNALA